jgi:hypothetical protein
VLLTAHVACGAHTPSGPSAVAPRTISVSGSVRDTAWRPIERARVEVTVGGGASTIVVTNSRGEFALSVSRPASAPITLQAAKEGFVPQTKVFDGNEEVPSPSLNALFELTETVPLLNLSGDYLATVAVDPGCDAMPPAARTRSYAATITTAADVSGHFRVELQSASLINDGTTMDAVAASDFVRFLVFPQRAENDEALPFVDMVDPRSFLAFAGAATADVKYSDSTMSARLEGWVAHCSVRPAVNPFSCADPTPVICRSSSHRLVLTRR